MTRFYYESDADPSALRGQSVAVVGYGNQGRSWALNLRDAGLAPRVCVRADATRERARADGFVTGEIADASSADVACLLVPDDIIPRLELTRGTRQLTIVASGYTPAFGRYAPPGVYAMFNELLKLKEGLQQGLTAEDISKSLLGRYSARTVDQKLDILKHIDSYLRTIKKPGEYHLIQRNVEKFNSLQANVVGPLQRRGKKDAEIADVIAVAYALIQKVPDDVTHWDIRLLREIALNEKAEKELGPILAEKPSKDTIVEAFTAAKEIVEDSAKKDKPERLVKRALSAIKSISPKSPRLAHAKVKSMLKDLAEQVQLLLKAK